MAIHNFESKAYATAVAEVRVTLDPEHEGDPFEERLVAFDVGPSVVVAGMVRGAPPGFADISTIGGIEAATAFYVPPEPSAIDTGATARWLPIDADVSPDESTWQANNTADPDFVIVQTATGGVAPSFDYDYSYEGINGRISRPAMVIDGNGFSTINNDGTATSATLILVLVPHNGVGPYYNFFQANESNPAYGGGEGLAIRYAKGRISVIQDNREVVAHEVFRPAQSAIVVGVSIDAASDEGRLVVIDTERTTRAFNVVDMDIVSFIGEIGSAYNYTITPAGRLHATHRGDLDLLEVDYWDSALSFAELEGVASLLAVAYGLST